MLIRLEDKKREIKNSIVKYDAKIKALENIKRVKTKKGEDFKILSKNFTGIEFENSPYRNNGKEITIAYSWKKENNHNYIYDQREYEQLYFRNLKITDETLPIEIECAISELIDQLKEYKSESERAYNLFDVIIPQFESDIKDLVESIKDVDKRHHLSNEFYYIALDILHNFY